MNKLKTKCFIALAGFSATAAYANAPSTPLTPTVDTSGDLALGPNALVNLGTPVVGATTFGNVAVGNNTLQFNTTGDQNTAVGDYALRANTTGSNNTAIGAYAMVHSTTGIGNTAIGANAMYLMTGGSYNTATGNAALVHTNGGNNTANGAYALAKNTSGSGNTALGVSALKHNDSGSNDVGIGYLALYSNTAGLYSTAVGYAALTNSLSGLGNIGLGPYAGKNIVQGQLNIDIGSWGSSDESNTIRIGIPQYHTHTYISGIATTQLTGAQVVVTPSGQLGVLASSERYKTEITPIASTTDKLSQLRPVSFHLKSEPHGAVQYGLIAEEVDKVYPELVIRDLEGKIQGVRYDELAPMLLNEVQNELQNQRQINASQAAKLSSLEEQVAKVNDLERQLIEMRTTLAALQPKDQLVAKR